MLHILCLIFILNIKGVVHLQLFLTHPQICFLLPPLSACFMICQQLDNTADFKTSLVLSCSLFVESKNGHQYVYTLFASSGPKPCEACRQEEMYEEPISILNSSEVSQRVQYNALLLPTEYGMVFQSGAYACCVVPFVLSSCAAPPGVPRQCSRKRNS